MYFDAACPERSRGARYKQRGFVNLLVILVASLVAGLFYWGKSILNLPKQTSPAQISATPKINIDEEAGWKTYTDNNHVFSFKYPEDWVTLNKGGIGAVLPNEELLVEPNVIVLTKKGIGISVYEDGGNLSGRQFLEKIFYAKLDDGAGGSLNAKYLNAQTYKTVIIDGVQTTEIDLTTAPGSKGKGVWITKGSLGILLRGMPVQGEEEVFNKILTTFKFLERNSQGYTCPENGWENCMPILSPEAQKQCSQEALDWKKTNCPDFKGAAY